MTPTSTERRDHPRSPIDWAVRISSATERRLPQARMVDASLSGVLLVLAEPAGFAVSQALVVSIEPEDDSFVVVGDVVRVERGADFRTYVALALRPTAGDELDRWRARLESPLAPDDDVIDAEPTPVPEDAPLERLGKVALAV